MVLSTIFEWRGTGLPAFDFNNSSHQEILGWQCFAQHEQLL